MPTKRKLASHYFLFYFILADSIVSASDRPEKRRRLNTEKNNICMYQQRNRFVFNNFVAIKIVLGSIEQLNG